MSYLLVAGGVLVLACGQIESGWGLVAAGAFWRLCESWHRAMF